MTKTLHVISHTHWDREWYLTFQQFRLKLVHLIDGLLDILEKDKNFKYFMLDGQTIVLDDYLHMRPEKFETLRDHVQKGRLVIGPWHILPDMFLVSPEAHIRNLLEGDRTARKFGPKMTIGYMPDSFGHIGQMPQILRGFGITAACLWRGLDDQPTEFWWQAPDGSQVLMLYLRDSYSNGASLPANDPAQFAQAIETQGNSLAPLSFADDLLIMFGTDHMAPPPATPAAIAHTNKTLKNKKVIHSTLPAYLKSLQKKFNAANTILPVVEGELRSSRRSHLLPGVLSTRMWIKQRNHASQTLLEKWAEPACAVAEWVLRDQPSLAAPANRIANPAPLLRQAWRLLMENHPHDSICGCSIDQVHEEMRPRFDQVDQIGTELTRQGLAAIAATLDTQPPGEGFLNAVVVFNPTSVPRTDRVVAELELPEAVEDFEILDEAHNVLPHQVTGTGRRELVNMTLDKRALFDAFGAINDGRVSGMVIKRIKVEQLDKMVLIHATLDEHGEPNLPEWQAGLGQIERLTEDPAVEHFHVRAFTGALAQVLFAAPSIPAHGWRTFWVRQKPDSGGSAAAPAPASINPITRPLIPLAMRLAQTPFGQNLLARLAPGDELKPPFRIENEFFIVEADEKTGALTVRDRLNLAVYRGLNLFVDGGDCGDEYNYCPPPADKLVTARLTSLKIFRRPVQPALELTFELEAPTTLSPERAARSEQTTTLTIVSRVSLTPGVPRVDVETSVDNTASDHRLRVHFPTPFNVKSADFDGHFEVVNRPVGLPVFDASWAEEPRPEAPQRAFVDVNDGVLGLMVANRGLPEVEVLANAAGKAEIALTLLRSVGWLSRDDFSARRGHAGPAEATPAAQVRGKWDFQYAIIPHTANYLGACQQAYAFEAPLRAENATLHEGWLPASGGFFGGMPASFVTSAIKETDDGRGLLFRGYNIGERGVEVTLKPWRAFKKAELANLAEGKLSALKCGPDGAVQFTARAREVVSVVFSD